MYAIIYWVSPDYLTFWHNADGSIRLFKSVKSADRFANVSDLSEELRVVTLEGIE